MVQTVWVFVLGEVFLISPIVVGFIWLKKFYDSNLKPLQNSSREVFKIYKQRDELFLKISKNFLEGRFLITDNLINAHKKNQKILN